MEFSPIILDKNKKNIKRKFRNKFVYLSKAVLHHEDCVRQQFLARWRERLLICEQEKEKQVWLVQTLFFSS